MFNDLGLRRTFTKNFTAPKTSVSPEIIIQSVVGCLFFTAIAFKYASSTTFFVIGKFTSRQFSLISEGVISKFCKPI